MEKRFITDNLRVTSLETALRQTVARSILLARSATSAAQLGTSLVIAPPTKPTGLSLILAICQRQGRPSPDQAPLWLQSPLQLNISCPSPEQSMKRSTATFLTSLVPPLYFDCVSNSLPGSSISLKQTSHAHTYGSASLSAVFFLPPHFPASTTQRFTTPE